MTGHKLIKRSSAATADPAQNRTIGIRLTSKNGRGRTCVIVPNLLLKLPVNWQCVRDIHH